MEGNEYREYRGGVQGLIGMSIGSTGEGCRIDWNEYREYRGGGHGLIGMSTSRVQVRDGGMEGNEYRN